MKNLAKLFLSFDLKRFALWLGISTIIDILIAVFLVLVASVTPSGDNTLAWVVGLTGLLVYPTLSHILQILASGTSTIFGKFKLAQVSFTERLLINFISFTASFITMFIVSSVGFSDTQQAFFGESSTFMEAFTMLSGVKLVAFIFIEVINLMLFVFFAFLKKSADATSAKV